MTEHINILTKEKTQLDLKIHLLQVYKYSKEYRNSSQVDQSLVDIQLYAMNTYSQVLGERIAWMKTIGPSIPLKTVEHDQ